MKPPLDYAKEIAAITRSEAQVGLITRIVSQAMNDAVDHAWAKWERRPRIDDGAQEGDAEREIASAIRHSAGLVAQSIGTAVSQALKDIAGSPPPKPGRLVTIRMLAPELGMTHDACRKFLGSRKFPPGVIVRFGRRGIRVDAAKLKDTLLAEPRNQ